MNAKEQRIVIPVQNVKAGEVIFEEGDHGKELYVIRSGRVSVRKLIDDQDIEIVQLEQGAIFGEMAILDQGIRSATVVAVEPTVVSRIDQNSYEQIVKVLPTWLKAILKIVAKRLADLNLKIDRPIVQKPLLSLSLFLFRKHREAFLNNLGPLNRKTIQDDFCFLTRLTPKEVDHHLESLIGFRILEYNKEEDKLRVENESLLRLYIDAHSALIKKKPFGPFELERSSIVFIQTLYSLNQTAPLPETADRSFWENLLKGLVQNVGFEAIQILSREGIFEIDINQVVKFDAKKLDQYHYAIANKTLVLDIK